MWYFKICTCVFMYATIGIISFSLIWLSYGTMGIATCSFLKCVKIKCSLFVPPLDPMYERLTGVGHVDLFRLFTYPGNLCNGLS